MKRETVCQVLHTLHVGGAEVLAAQLARRLSDEFRVVFACLEELGTLGVRMRDEGFSVHVLEKRPGVDRRCAARLADLFRKERIDLVHAHQYGPFFYAATARLPRRRPAVLFTEHGRHVPDLPRLSHKIANRLLLERRDRVVGVGEAVRRALIDNEGFPSDRVEVVHNGIDLTPFQADGQDRDTVRREIGVGPDDFVMVQVARLNPLKDHATALRTLGRLVQHRPDARLVLVGDGPEANQINARINDLGLAPHVRALGTRHDVVRLFRAADAALLTSLSEGIPLALIEAMAAGLPVVATRVGGVPEVVQEGETGLLAPSGDDAGLAEAVIRLADDPALRTRLGRSGRDRALSLFNEARMHHAYRRIYHETISGPVSGRPARPAATYLRG